MKIVFSAEEHSPVQSHELFKSHASWSYYYYSKDLNKATLQKLPVFWRQFTQYNKACLWMMRMYSPGILICAPWKEAHPRLWMCHCKSQGLEIDGVRLTLFLWLGNPAPSPEISLIFSTCKLISQTIFSSMFHNQAFHAPGDRETNEAEKSFCSQLLQRNLLRECFMECGKGRCSFCQNSKFPGLKP